MSSRALKDILSGRPEIIFARTAIIYNCRSKNDDYYHKGREGRGQRVMIEIIISENYDDGRPLRMEVPGLSFPKKN